MIYEDVQMFLCIIMNYGEASTYLSLFDLKKYERFGDSLKSLDNENEYE